MAEDTYDDENKQKWEFRKVWTRVVEPLLTTDDITSEDVARAVVKAAFHQGCKIVDEENAVPLVFKPTNVRIREDKSTEIICVKFKPGKPDNLGKRWTLIAQNSLADFLHPTMTSENRPNLKNELIAVVNGAVKESSQQIILDQDERETKVVFLSTSASTESEIRCFKQMCQDFFLDWHLRVKGREKIMAAVPLPFIILPEPKATPAELQQQNCHFFDCSTDEEELIDSDADIQIISEGKKGFDQIPGGGGGDCDGGTPRSSSSKEEYDSDETVKTGHTKKKKNLAKKSRAHDNSDEIFSTPPTSPITSHPRSSKVAKRVRNGFAATGNARDSGGSDSTDCIVLSDVDVIKESLVSPAKGLSGQPSAKSDLDNQVLETSAETIMITIQRGPTAKDSKKSPASIPSPRKTKGTRNSGSPEDPPASRKKVSYSKDSGDRTGRNQVSAKGEEIIIESSSEEETFVSRRGKRSLQLRKYEKTRAKELPRSRNSAGHTDSDEVSRSEKYTYETLKDLADELSSHSGSLYKRNVYGLVVRVMKSPKPDSEGYCTAPDSGICEVQISDLTMSDVYARLCTVKYSDIDPNINMQAGPAIHVGDIIRIHRATVQFEIKPSGKQIAVSTAPHCNYTLFDGNDGPLEASCRRLGKKPADITAVDRKMVKDLRSLLKRINSADGRNSTVEEVNHSINFTRENGQTEGVAAGELELNPGNNTEPTQHPPAEQNRPIAAITIDERLENHPAASMETPMILESQATIIDSNPGQYILMSDDEPVDDSPDENAGESCGDLTFKSSIPVPESGIYLIKHPKNRQRLRIDRVEHIAPSDDKSYNLFIKVLDVEVLKSENRNVVLLRVKDSTIPSCEFQEQLVTDPPDDSTIDIEASSDTDPQQFMRLAIHMHEPLLLMAVRVVKPNGRGIPALKMEMKDIFFLQ